MSDNLTAEPTKTARWSPRKFARARMEGHTLAECAKIAGSKATDESSLARIGYRWVRSPKVQKCLGDLQADLERGWQAWVRHAADVCDGLVPGATEIDILGNGQAIGRALGKFVQRHEVTHLQAIGYRRLFDASAVQAIEGQASVLPAPKAVPALPAGLSDDELRGAMAAIQAEIERRAALATQASPDSRSPVAGDTSAEPEPT